MSSRVAARVVGRRARVAAQHVVREFLTPTSSGRLAALVFILVGLLELEVVVTMLLTVSGRDGFIAIDYWVLAAAGRLVSGGKVAYDHAALVRSMLRLSPLADAAHPGGGFAYAPWVAIAFAPFGRVSYWAGLIVWTAISAVSLVWSVGRWWAWWHPPISRRWLTLATLVSYPVASGLRLGQLDAILLGLVTLSFAAFLSNRWFWVGAIAVMAAFAKPQDLLWLPIGYLLLTHGKRIELRRFLGGSAGMGLILGVGPVIVNHRAWEGYLQSLMSISRFQPDWASISGLMRWVPQFKRTRVDSTPLLPTRFFSRGSA
ncbi:MAG TPA: glycosyltransferase family 87 protein [Candidatus Dormibacteraeota bacterium]|nr:glycosyltransferase family 87 protein [Candidatus Dormibacteraeota bacterium]